jgi:hypothetical protein
MPKVPQRRSTRLPGGGPSCTPALEFLFVGVHRFGSSPCGGAPAEVQRQFLQRRATTFQRLPDHVGKIFVGLRMRYVILVLILIVGLIGLSACGRRNIGRIEPVAEENGERGEYWQRLTASTNCAEIGEEVLFTAEIINEGTRPLTVADTPPFDIIIRPFRFGGNAGPIQRWSETDQYPQDINPVLAPGETRTYTWRWIADAAYAQGTVNKYGTSVIMPLTLAGQGTSPLPHVVVGVKAHPEFGNGGAFCSDLRR